MLCPRSRRSVFDANSQSRHHPSGRDLGSFDPAGSCGEPPRGDRSAQAPDARCGRARHQLAKEEGRLGEYLQGSTIALPDHGCAENLTWALEPHGINYPDIPSPINLFQNMEIDRATGAMRRTQIRPASPVPVALRAEMDLLVAFSACPDLASPNGGQEVRVEILLN